MKSILVLCAAATMATAGAETRVQVSSAMSDLMYNTKNACGGNFNNCASRKCYSLSVGNQVFVRDMHPSQESWNVYKVADWKSFKPDDQAGPQAEHPGHTLLAARSTNPTPLLVSFSTRSFLRPS